MRGNLLMMRWALLNLAFGVLAWFGWKAGLVQQAWSGDTTWFTVVILAFVIAGFVMCTRRLIDCSVMLDQIDAAKRRGGAVSGRVREYLMSRRDLVAKETLRAKLDARIRPIEWLAYCLVTLGFLAIIWGMKEGLYAIAVMDVQDASGAVKIVQVLVQHFTIALWPTITGIVGYMALSFNIVLLQGGYDRLYTKLLEDAE